jgi:predicted helicase
VLRHHSSDGTGPCITGSEHRRALADLPNLNDASRIVGCWNGLAKRAGDFSTEELLVQIRDQVLLAFGGNHLLGAQPDRVRRSARLPLGSRTALEWIIDRYQVKTDKASGIVNDPNDWCDEHDNPTYIVDLIKKVTTVSVRTVELVGQLAA